MRKLYVICGLLIFFVTHTAFGNPVPDKAAMEFRALVETTARTGRCPNPDRLVDYFGRYGLSFLEPSQIGSMIATFESFVPFLVQSQEGKYLPNYALQSFFRDHANPSQRAQMIGALRTCLTAEMTEAPIAGGMKIVEPESHVRSVILAARARAAEMLAEWSDEESIADMRALLLTPEITEQLKVVVKRSIARVNNPCAMTFLARAAGGRLACCADSSLLVEGTIVRESSDDTKITYELTKADLNRLWNMLNSGIYREHYSVSGGSTVVTLTLQNGIVATLEKPGRYAILYKDNGTLDFRQEITITSRAFYEWFDSFQPSWEHRILKYADARRSQTDAVLVEYQESLNVIGERGGTRSGMVDLRVLVGIDGSAKDAEIIRSTDTLLDKPALEVARVCVFEPAKWRGKPVERWIYVPIRFDRGSVRVSN